MSTTPTGPTDQPYGVPPSGAGQPPYGGSSPALGGGDYLGDEQPTPARSRGRSFAPWIIGLAVVLVIGGGAFAVQAALGDGDDQPAGALPASTIAYGRIDLDPSATQKIAALRLAQRFPGFSDATGITDEDTDLRRKLWETMTESDGAIEGVDYDADIEPWLGSRVAFGYVPGTDDATPETGMVVAIQVTDEDAAEAGIDKLMAAGDTADEPAGVAFSGDYALIATTQALADQYAADAEESSLADNEDFTRDMEALGEQGVASFWVSKAAYEEIADVAGQLAPLDMVGAGVGGSMTSVADQGNLAMALRFEEDALEVGFVVTESEQPALTGGDADNLVTRLPDSTLLAVGSTSGSEYVEQAWSQLLETGESSGMNIERELKSFERQTGITMPDDLATLLGDGFAIAVDGEGLDDMTNLQDPSALRIGALFDTDVDAAQDVLDKVVAALGGGLPLETSDTDGLLSVSLNADYAAELAGGSLGETSAFRAAVPDGADADFVFYFSMDALEGSELYSSEVDGEVAANLNVLSAIGMSGTYEDGVGRGSLRVVLGE